MRNKAIIILFLISSICPAISATLPGTKMSVDWPKMVSRQDITLTTPPTDTVHGLLLGNGDIGVSVYGSADSITLQVGKNDLWDYRDPSDNLPPPIKHKDFLARYSGADTSTAATQEAFNAAVYAAHTTPMHTAKPAGQIRFINSTLKGPAFSSRLRLWDAEVTTGKDSAAMRAFVSHQRNLIVAQYDLAGNNNAVDIQLARHWDATGTIPNGPEFGANGRDFWLSYKFPADPTYPQGFEYVMYGRVVGGKVTTEVKPNAGTAAIEVWFRGAVQVQEGMAVAHVTSAKPIMLLVAVVTTRDARNPLAEAIKIVSNADKSGLAKLRSEHRQYWHRFWQRSFVQLPKNDYLTRHWFVSNYHLACCSRPGKIAPGLYGNWAYQDASAWWSDYHWDYNFQQEFYGAYSSNHLEQAEPYNDTVLGLLPAARNEARAVYGMRGAKFFITSYPRKTRRNPTALIPYDKAMSLSAWAAQETWWYYLYSQNKDYLRAKSYPVMRDCAEFYEDYLTLASDGKYDIVPTYSPEHWGITGNFDRNKNCLLDLALIKYLMNACVEASKVLGVDEAKRPMWTKIANNLRGYPTTDTPNGKVFVDVENAPFINYNVPIPVTAMFPGDDIGLHSPPNTREIALRTAQSIPYNLTNDYILLAMSKVRLGVDVLKEFEDNTKRLAFPNGVLIDTGMPSIWVENFAAPIVMNESIVQSYNGILRFAPVKLAQMVRFAGLRTVGAFLVSGEIKPGGEISYIAITADAGGKCRVYRPWNGDVRIRLVNSMKRVQCAWRGGVGEFATVKGTTYILDRPSNPWEKQPLSVLH